MRNRMQGFFRRCCWSILASVCALGASSHSTFAQSSSVTDDQVDALIDQLVKIIKDRNNGFAEITVNGEITVLSTGEKVRVSGQSYRGTMLSDTGKRIRFETMDGMKFEVAKEHVSQMTPAGFFSGEKTDYHSSGGRTALAIYALLSAGVDRYDPVIQTALDGLERHPMPGTYGRALRASIYSHLVQTTSDPEKLEKYTRLLQKDARWLVQAMKDSDGYGYTNEDDVLPASRSSWIDCSNTQFGNLGVWISAIAGYQVGKHYWERVERYWFAQQNESGGWAYQKGNGPSVNMTIAGVNSLIIVLDQLYAKAGGQYVRFKGIPRNPTTWEKIQQVHAAIGRGMTWLAQFGKPYGEAYTQLGTERLGLASGWKYFGSQDWYRNGALGALQITDWENKSIEDVSMWLIFLAYGRAPILVNKLKWGDPDSGWDYYYRDMYHACRYVSNTYENLYKWQIIDTQATPDDLGDAPILYIAGDRPFWVSDQFAAKIKDFVNHGGLVVGHADLASPAFAKSFQQKFEQLFADNHQTFRELPLDHPIYRYTGGQAPVSQSSRIPVSGLSDGFRDIVLLIPVDIAGAWHQSLMQEYPECFHLMAGLRFYATGRYEGLPGRLRRTGLSGSPAAPIGSLIVLRPQTSADPGGAPTVWQTMNALLSHFYGVVIHDNRTARLANLDEAKAPDLVHIAGQGSYRFDDQEIQSIKNYMRNGGLIFIEAIGGNEAFAKSCESQFRELFGDDFKPLGRDDSLIRGDFTRGRPLQNITFTHGARQAGSSGDLPILFQVQQNGRTVVIFSPLDLSISADGNYIPDLRGYDTLSAQKILRNILLYRYAEISKNN